MEMIDQRYTKLNLILERFLQVRETTEKICAPLIPEDFILSVTEDTSPPKWHLAHTTWFLENFILMKFVDGYVPQNKEYFFLFNSYYKSLGEYLPKSKRQFLSRPSADEIFNYRRQITFEVMDNLALLNDESLEEASEILEIGIQHEQQHQELLVMDIKRNFFENPLRPVYQNITVESLNLDSQTEWKHVTGGLCEIGVSVNEKSFAYDNEKDSHQVWVDGFMLASHLSTNAEFLEFIHDGGYQNPLLWLSDGWDTKVREGWTAPLYWEEKDGQWWTFSLSGMVPLEPSAPVCHISYYEAYAFAKWKNCRLPTESEWEIAARSEQDLSGHFLDEENFTPKIAADSKKVFSQIHGTVWEWTQSAYRAYPRYEQLGHGLSEYNEKFMCNQFVLRGGSCVTPKSHYRVTYRNFYYPHHRWQFAGVRLAKDLV